MEEFCQTVMTDPTGTAITEESAQRVITEASELPKSTEPAIVTAPDIEGLPERETVGIPMTETLIERSGFTPITDAEPVSPPTTLICWYLTVPICSVATELCPCPSVTGIAIYYVVGLATDIQEDTVGFAISVHPVMTDEPEVV